MNSIFTIGYGNRAIGNFIDLLLQNQIELLVDIRSKPYSKFRPAFNLKSLEKHLQVAGIEYTFKGIELGGKPNDETFYTNYKPNYEKLRNTNEYKAGLAYLTNQVNTNKKVAIMCAELDYNHCHRWHLVGVDMKQLGFTILHINKQGILEEYQGLF